LTGGALDCDYNNKTECARREDAGMEKKPAISPVFTPSRFHLDNPSHNHHSPHFRAPNNDSLTPRLNPSQPSQSRRRLCVIPSTPSTPSIHHAQRLNTDPIFITTRRQMFIRGTATNQLQSDESRDKTSQLLQLPQHQTPSLSSEPLDSTRLNSTQLDSTQLDSSVIVLKY
jgi:hypothetical protein